MPCTCFDTYTSQVDVLAYAYCICLCWFQCVFVLFSYDAGCVCMCWYWISFNWFELFVSLLWSLPVYSLVFIHTFRRIQNFLLFLAHIISIPSKKFRLNNWKRKGLFLRFYWKLVSFFTIFWQLLWSMGNMKEMSMSYCGNFSLEKNKKKSI